MSYRRHADETMMEVNGLVAQLNTPEALKSEVWITCNECGAQTQMEDGKKKKKKVVCPECRSGNIEIVEKTQGLPPYDPVEVHVVDEYPACPDDWMHGSGKASSYFCGVKPGRGMWFDFTPNQNHKHHVAVVVSVQGINPVTGHPTNNDLGMSLQQIKNKCPKHGCDLEQDRYCPKCGYKLPAQNYIASTTGESLWIDGFRNEKGEVRQYILTEEESRGVAAQIIKDQRVWAIGFAFYLSKEPKPQPAYATRNFAYGGGMKTMSAAPTSFGFAGDDDFALESMDSCEAAAAPVRTRGAVRAASAKRKATRAKKLEVGAGAKIDQEVGVDPEKIEFWEPEPAGLIYVNYAQPEIIAKIIEAGKRQEKEDGFLNQLNVGN